MVKNKWELWKKRNLVFKAITVWLLIAAGGNIYQIFWGSDGLYPILGLIVSLLVLIYMWIDLRPLKEYTRYYG